MKRKGRREGMKGRCRNLYLEKCPGRKYIKLLARVICVGMNTFSPVSLKTE